MMLQAMTVLGAPDTLDGVVRDVRAIELHELAWSLGLLVGALLAGRVVSGLIVRSLKRWARSTTTLLDDAVAKHLPRPLGLLLPTVAALLVLPMLPFRSDMLNHAVLVVAIMAGGWTAFRLLRVLEDYLESRLDLKAADNIEARATYTQLRSFRNIGGFALILLTVAFALMTFETVRNIGTGLLASAGVAGIVLGFAAQRTIATVLAGVQIAVAQPIRAGDVVIVEGEWGTIEEITLTYVVVKVWDLRRLVVPVSYFIEKPFQNWTRREANLLGTVELRLDYSVPVEALRSELARVLEASKYWDHASSGVQVTDATERTMLVRALMSAKNAGDLFDLRCEVREKLLAFVQASFPDALPRYRTEVAERRKAA